MGSRHEVSKQTAARDRATAAALDAESKARVVRFLGRSRASFPFAARHAVVNLIGLALIGAAWARQARIPGGAAYGYDVVADRDASGGGRRTINGAEAAIVRRVFEEDAAGAGPRIIAKRSNDEHVPGSGGREWRDTTIRGQVDRGTGLMNNTLYIGRLEWNRTAYVTRRSPGSTSRKRARSPTPGPSHYR
jgi:hypothetical protein